MRTTLPNTHAHTLTQTCTQIKMQPYIQCMHKYTLRHEHLCTHMHVCTHAAHTHSPGPQWVKKVIFPARLAFLNKHQHKYQCNNKWFPRPQRRICGVEKSSDFQSCPRLTTELLCGISRPLSSSQPQFPH